MIPTENIDSDSMNKTNIIVKNQPPTGDSIKLKVKAKYSKSSVLENRSIRVAPKMNSIILQEKVKRETPRWIQGVLVKDVGMN